MNELHLFPRAKAERKVRIETQIHRRRAAKASGPMEAEWDCSQGRPSSQGQVDFSLVEPNVSVSLRLIVRDGEAPSQ
ncbi:MAG: hypothetical protein OEY28_00305 [Nitrospira sp.]|nr:hypothetical protein [Nitrospira sp.]